MNKITKFINKNKKVCIIILVTFLVLVLGFFTIFFIIPSFGNNVYGHRLDDIDKHKIAKSTTDDIIKELKEKDGINKVTYHQEGRILTFTITTTGLDINKAKEYANIVPEGISDKNLKYYDIQILLDASDNEKDYPTAGYKHKTADEIVWGNVGEASE